MRCYYFVIKSLKRNELIIPLKAFYPLSLYCQFFMYLLPQITSFTPVSPLITDFTPYTVYYTFYYAFYYNIYHKVSYKSKNRTYNVLQYKFKNIFQHISPSFYPSIITLENRELEAQINDKEIRRQ